MMTVSQAENWRPEALAHLGETWGALADRLDTLADALARQDRSIWTGTAADSAWANLTESQWSTRYLATTFERAAVAARYGSEIIGTARSAVVTLVSAVRKSDYLVSDTGTVTPVEVTAWSAELAIKMTAEVCHTLRALGTADAEAATVIAEAFQPAGQSPGAVAPATVPAGADAVAGWPSMSQDNIADQIAGMSPQQRQELIRTAPQQVGNTDGVPWPMRVEANRINIGRAIEDERRRLDRSDADKIAAALENGFGPPRGYADILPAGGIPALVYGDPRLRAAAVAFYNGQVNDRIDFCRGLLAPTPDPTGRSTTEVPRQILAFDPARSALIELHGDLGSARSVGVLVPGTNTTLLRSPDNVETARRFVAAGRGDVAMITYLGGPFPSGPDTATGLMHAADPQFALAMAPRLVAFSEDVDRTVDATGRSIPVTYLGHSYGGSILGTAERLGLTADRTVYVEAAGAGVGVADAEDWHNRNPYVQRYSMTAPLDPIMFVQGIPGGPHGADPDWLEGVTRLGTGLRRDGSIMSGLDSHSAVLNERSDAWRNLLAVITGAPTR